VRIGRAERLREIGTQVTLNRRTLGNRGTTVWASGGILPRGALIANASALEPNSETGTLECPPCPGDLTMPLIYDTGAIAKTAGGGTTQIKCVLSNTIRPDRSISSRPRPMTNPRPIQDPTRVQTIQDNRLEQVAAGIVDHIHETENPHGCGSQTAGAEGGRDRTNPFHSRTEPRI
jgi:hypothetical protein